MNIIYAEYNMYHNSIDIHTSNSQCSLNALAIDKPLAYAMLYLDGPMQMWIDAEDSLNM